MGFAASQARFLSLTARLSDNEYEAQQIAQERLALASSMEIFSDEYEAATSNEVYLANVFMGDGNLKEVTLTYDVITKDVPEGGLGMKLVTSSGLVVVPNLETASKMGLAAGEFFILEEIRDADVLKTNLEQGNMFFATEKDLSDKKGNEEISNIDKWDMKSPEMLSGVRKDYDRSDDAAADAKYQKRMRKFEKQDAALEMRLQELETQHRAVSTEMESLEKVIDDNTEKSFGTFG